MALHQQVPISTVFTPEESQGFLRAMGCGGMKEVEQALAKLDIRNANASVESDIERIITAVEKEVGVVTFNENVRAGLTAAYVHLGQRATFSMSGGSELKRPASAIRNVASG